MIIILLIYMFYSLEIRVTLFFISDICLFILNDLNPITFEEKPFPSFITIHIG